MLVLARDGDIDSILNSLEGNIIYKLIFTFVAMIIQNSFTIIPLLLLITINISLFGFINGFLWSWFTSVIAGVVVFLAVRYRFQDKLLKKITPNVIEKVERNGFLYVFEARIIPFVPTSFVNILAGISSIKFKPFFFGTLFGNFIYFFVLSLIPLGVLSLDIDQYLLGVIVILSIVIIYLFKKFSKRSKGQKPYKLFMRENEVDRHL